jgi:uncharacterized protein YcbK (DUF882 family)
MMLSKNFSLKEFTRSQTARRFNIINEPTWEEIRAMTILCNRILQPIRDHYRKPVFISSGFRSIELNEKIGGASKSQHPKGEAADIEVEGISNYDLAVWIKDTLEFDQIIMEGVRGNIINSGWVHVSFVSREENRGSVLTKDFSKKGYMKGLIRP